MITEWNHSVNLSWPQQTLNCLLWSAHGCVCTNLSFVIMQQSFRFSISFYMFVCMWVCVRARERASYRGYAKEEMEENMTRVLNHTALACHAAACMCVHAVAPSASGINSANVFPCACHLCLHTQLSPSVHNLKTHVQRVFNLHWEV